MQKNETPNWLIDIQNKSWEPEILISGITLTFLFILSNHIYNFYGMLVQDYAVFEVIPRILYRISIGILSGFKIVLIIHLILRGFWTGLIGLSYVFPQGINKQNVKKQITRSNFPSPETYVIKFEKICSLLFAIIFNSLIFVFGFFLIMIPITLLFIFGLDIYYIHLIAHYFIAPLTIVVAILWMIFIKKIQKSRLNQSLEKTTFSFMLAVLLSNLGYLKTFLIFLSIFLIVWVTSFSDMAKFDFKNRRVVENSNQITTVKLDKNQYEKMRDTNLRIPKATLENFRISGPEVQLFVSYFKEDKYTVKKLVANKQYLKEFDFDSSSTHINLVDLLRISIDDKLISHLTWYRINHPTTNQDGFMTTIPLDSLNNGLHQLEIDKIYWSVRKDSIQLLKNWEVVPFDLDRKR